MYLKQVFLKNCGPVDECVFNLPFNENKNPKPLILVGENGTGKTIFLSYVVDALHEFFIRNGYKNLVGVQNTSNISLGHSMYKISGYFNKKLRTPNAITSLIFTNDDNKLSEYIATQDISVQDAKKEISEKFPDLTLPSIVETNRTKVISEDTELYKREYQKGCFIFFPDYRQEQPIWINKDLKQIQPQLMEDRTQKPLLVDCSQNENTSWLLDIILDAAQNNSTASYFSNIATVILQKIMKRTDVFIATDERKLGGVNRITVGFKEKNNNLALCPRINALSEGQSTLLNMFLTILRYADNDSITSKEDITGIVIIDEIENHLHDDITANILPELIKMFPKIQFIITTHSPMFLLGMKERFGSNGFEIREMPTGAVINPEDYSQFQVMFDIVSKTEKVKKLIDIESDEKELVITEGQTDWMHMKHAFERLNLPTPHFLEYNDSMGNDVLKQICTAYTKIPHKKTIICIFDSDKQKYIRMHENCVNGIKNWGNNVYSFCIPIPDFRSSEPNISIEMYYPDTILKTITTINEKEKCMYFDNELSCSREKRYILNEADLSRAGNRKIIDDIDSIENPYNKPLIKTKKEFAEEIVKDKIWGVDFGAFRLIHDKIKEIIPLTEVPNQNS